MRTRRSRGTSAGKRVPHRPTAAALAVAVAFGVSQACPAPARAEVATDGTLGRKVKLTGPNIEVGADLGRVRGKNLFHSFERFGVEGGGKVTFTGPSGLDNVVSRVTGGEPSAINGTLASTVPGADVWLVNPAGIVFGPGATLDVPGSFHASTADELRFSDGVAFSASDPGRGGLSVARPEAFGFLGAGKPAAITAQGAAYPIDAGEAISLVGGDVLLLGSQISGSGSSVTLAGLGGPGSIDVVAGTVEGDASATVALGTTLVFATGEGGGKVLVRAGDFLVLGGARLFNGTGDQDTARGTTIEAGRVLVAGAGSLIGQNSVGAGDPGPLVVRAGEVTLRDGGAISGVTGSGGNGADILLEAGRLVIDGGRLDSNALPTSTAERAGNVTVVADEVVATRDGVIQSSTLSGTDAGRVRIEADRVTLTDGGLVQSDTFGSGAAGGVEVAAGRLVIGGGLDSAGFTGITANTAGGAAGSVVVSAREVEISDAGTIQSGTFGPSAAGSVRVAANDVRIRSGGSITTNTGSSAPAGEIRIEAGRLSINGAGAGDSLTGVASASASPTGGATGPAGSISIAAREVDVDRGFVTTAGAGAEGGRIEVAADRVILLDDAVVTSTGITPAPGASLITLRAPTIVLNDSRVTSLTGAGTPLGGSGEASLLGDVTVISADSLVAASSSVVTTGLQTDLGTELQLAPGAFLDAGDLLGQGCAARRTGKASSFTRAGRGGLPPSPDRPLASGETPERGRAAAEARVAGNRLLVAGGPLQLAPAACDSSEG